MSLLETGAASISAAIQRGFGLTSGSSVNIAGHGHICAGADVDADIRGGKCVAASDCEQRHRLGELCFFIYREHECLRT